VTSLLVLWAILHSERPADADHPWGHGKAEGLISLFQAVLILASGLALAWQIVERALGEAPPIALPWLGILVMVASSIGTMLWIARLRKVARSSGSPALEADSAHYSTDVMMNIGVVAGLALSSLLGGATWPDLVVGGGITLLILNTAREILLQGIGNLMDRGLDPRQEARVLSVVRGFAPEVSGFHDLRTRSSGAEIFLELHLDLANDMSFVAAHDLSEQVGRALEHALPRSRVTVHADPL